MDEEPQVQVEVGVKAPQISQRGAGTIWPQRFEVAKENPGEWCRYPVSKKYSNIAYLKRKFPEWEIISKSESEGYIYFRYNSSN